MTDYERFLARMAAWEARAKVVRHGPDDGTWEPGPGGCIDYAYDDDRDYKAERRALRGARERCEDPANKAYKHYGARGIQVCPDWRGYHGFERFLAHIGPRPDKGYTLDRIDNNRGYEPGNVRWATWIEQANNRRSSRWITWRGERHTAAEWGRILGIRRQEVIKRANKGRSLKKRYRRTA